MVSVRVHTTTTFFAFLFAAAGGFAGGVSVAETSTIRGPLFIVPVSLTLVVPAVLWRIVSFVAKRIPARCPKCGAASFVRRLPVVDGEPRHASRGFVCVACGNVRETGVQD